MYSPNVNPTSRANCMWNDWKTILYAKLAVRIATQHSPLFHTAMKLVRLFLPFYFLLENLWQSELKYFCPDASCLHLKSCTLSEKHVLYKKMLSWDTSLSNVKLLEKKVYVGCQVGQMSYFHLQAKATILLKKSYQIQNYFSVANPDPWPARKQTNHVFIILKNLTSK